MGFHRALIPDSPGGRPRKTDLRDVVDAVFYILSTACPERYPPKSTVWRFFDEWRHNGNLDLIRHTLCRQVRTAEKPCASSTTVRRDRLGGSMASSEAFVEWAMIQLMLNYHMAA